MPEEYDVVIVGGRPAGASLAARLGARGLRVLVVDKACFPSLPAVPSSPALYPAGMAMLDEIGVDEADYAGASVRMNRLWLRFDRHIEASFEVPMMWGREHVRAIDRRGFDDVLWRNLERFPSVERREGFAVTELLRDDGGRVIGVAGSERGGSREQLRGRCIVGADGRFSLVARKAGAAVTEAEDRWCSTVYFSTWDGVRFDDDSSGMLFASGRGLDVLILPQPGGGAHVNTHHRADRAVIAGDPQRYYLETLRTVAGASERLRQAEQRDDLVGVKHIGNGYRQAGGDGWVLVGDAVHYKDPADGQGIYDAMLSSKLLDQSLGPWLLAGAGGSWAEVVAGYQRELLAATRPMYLETVARLRRELYDEPPTFIVKTLIRWTMTDPLYQRRFMQYLGREISPTGWSGPGLIAGAVARGIWRDVTGARR